MGQANLAEAKDYNGLQQNQFGRGIAFVGREYRLTGWRHEKFIDLHFYIIPLHRYYVVEGA